MAGEDYPVQTAPVNGCEVLRDEFGTKGAQALLMKIVETIRFPLDLGPASRADSDRSNEVESNKTDFLQLDNSS